MTIHDHIYQVVFKKDLNSFKQLSDEDRKSWSSFMILKYLSQDISLLPTVNLLNMLHNVSDEDMFLMMCKLIPKRKYDLSYIVPFTRTKSSLQKALKVIYNLTDKEADMYEPLIDKKDTLYYIQMAGLHN